MSQLIKKFPNTCEFWMGKSQIFSVNGLKSNKIPTKFDGNFRKCYDEISDQGYIFEVDV